MMDLEICTDSFDGAMAAAHYGMKRIELCANLSEGGTTPSFGLIQKCTSLKTVEVHVMIRPRPGSFVYSETELDVMARDILASPIAGAKGVVFGCLTNMNELDMPATIFLVETALKQKLEITFHRAFDSVKDYEQTVDHLVNLGVKRILTSGGAASAPEGISGLKKLVELSHQRIQIMAGGGVNGTNAKQLIETGIDALHFTARRIIAKSEIPGMGDDYETDHDKIRSILQAIS
jgi:copper homeostasis protein